jgi:hypothetical protein
MLGREKARGDFFFFVVVVEVSTEERKKKFIFDFEK